MVIMVQCCFQKNVQGGREGEGKEGKTTALDIFQEGANIPERGGVLVPAFKKKTEVLNNH